MGSRVPLAIVVAFHSMNVVHVAADSFPDFDADLPDLGTDQSVDSQRDRYDCVNVTPIVGGCYTGHFGYHLHEGITVKINTFDKASSKGTMKLEGFGRIPLSCNTSFHKESSAIDADLSCIPSDKLHFSIKYCEAIRGKQQTHVVTVGLKIDRKGHEIWNTTLYENKTCEGHVTQSVINDSLVLV